MAKASKQAAEEAEETADVTPKKGKKKLIIIIAGAVLLAVVAVIAVLYLFPASNPKHGDAEKTHAVEEQETQATFVDLGTFTANLMHEDGDRVVQISISLKLKNPKLEEKVKANNPEIQHHINMLLQSKFPSELSTLDGKQKLANQIKAEIEQVLGLRKILPTDPPNVAPTSNRGISEVLFTSLIIQ